MENGQQARITGESGPHPAGLIGLAFGALGIVYGDIGTSPCTRVSGVVRPQSSR